MKAVRFGPTPGNLCQKLLHGHRQTRWTVVSAEKGCKETGAAGGRGHHAWNSLCRPISKVECDHRVHGEAVGTGETCNCISVHLPSTYLVFSFLDAHCNFCLFFYTGTVRD